MVRAHRGIIIVLIAFIGLALWYSITTPLFEAPDEQWHFAFVQHVATGRGLPVQSLDNPNQHLARQEGSQPPLYYLLAASATFWIDTSDYPDIVWENPHYGYNVPGIMNDNKNLFIHTSAESFPYRGASLAIHLARIISILMGALAVLFTYLLALEILPNQKSFATIAASLVAFVPQFIFISAAVSNYSTITAMSALSLWLIARVIKTDDRRPTTVTLVALGIACGLAAIAKVSGAAMFPLAFLVLGWQTWRTRKESNRIRLFDFFLFTFAFALVASGWYLRNLFLYGELTGTEIMAQIFFARQTPLTIPQLIAQVGEVWETFWVGFGWGNIRAIPAVYSVIDVFALIGTVGLILFMIYDLGFRISIHSNENPKSETLAPHASAGVRNPKFPLLILIAWVAIIFIALVRWMMLTQAPHGRLMFPALPAIAVLLAFGLNEFHIPNITHHASRITFYALRFSFPIFSFILAAFAPIAILQPAYAYPTTLNANEITSTLRPVDIVYGDKMKLIGYELSSRRTQPGESLTLTLYWQSLTPMDDDYSIGIRVLDANGREIGKRDSYPGHGMLPTRLWYAGQIIRDEYWLPINADATPGLAKIQISLYSRATRRDLPASDTQGNTITPFIAQIKIGTPQITVPQMQFTTGYRLNKQITLIGYDIISAANVTLPNPGFQVNLYWKRIAPIDGDYTVFVHAVDANDEFIAQQDRQPADGTNPTSLWDDGEIVIDKYIFSLPTNTPIAQKIIIGMYRINTNERLAITDANGNPLGDHIELPLTGTGK